MFRAFVCLVLLNVFIGYSNVGVASLVTRNNYSFGICQVPDARVLQTIELVAAWPTKGFTNLLPNEMRQRIEYRQKATLSPPYGRY